MKRRAVFVAVAALAASTVAGFALRTPAPGRSTQDIAESLGFAASEPPLAIRFIYMILGAHLLDGASAAPRED